MNKKAFIAGYCKDTPQFTAAQTVVILGRMAKEAGLVIPQEEVDAVLNAPMNKIASEDTVAMALFLEGYSMNKNAGIGDFLQSAGESYKGLTDKLPPGIRQMANPLGYGIDAVSEAATARDYANINRGAGNTGLAASFSGGLDKLLEPTGLTGVSKGIDAKRLAAKSPWYTKIWEWIKANPGKSALGGLGGAYLLSKLMGGRKQPQRPAQYPAYR